MDSQIAVGDVIFSSRHLDDIAMSTELNHCPVPPSLGMDGLERHSLHHFETDNESQKYGEKMLAEASSQRDQCAKNTWNRPIRSRVLKDPFHIFNMFYISTSHGLRFDYSYSLRDAFFIYDREGQARILAWGSTLNPPLKSWGDIVRKFGWDWIHRHCKRVIPPPEELYPLVEEVF